MRKTVLLLLLSLALLSLAALKPAAKGEGSSRTAPPDSVVPAVVADTLADDTASAVALTDSARTDSAAKPDSAHTDTLSLGGKESGIEDPVDYTAEDSLVYDADSRFVRLYGKATVKYQNMTLDAGRISLNMDSTIVHATFLSDTTDTTGLKKEQLPLYRQGSDEYESENMSFNFKSKKGFIENVSTTQGNGFLKSSHSKRTDDGTLYLENATYTTCDAEHPHFYLKLTRGKVNPGRETVFGPAYLVVADVPTPIAIPYGFYPFNKKYSSGFVMPSYGDETSRGFYLRDGGYYFAISDYIDLKALGEIYTKGSWGVSLESNYRKRYRFNGNFFFSYITTVEGEKNMPDYLKTKSLKVQWTHTKDAAAGGNTTFTARVNFASENYERKNLSSMYNPLSYSQSTRASSISFSHNFPDWGLSLSGSANLTQNMRDSTINLVLPNLSWNLTRRYPFRRKRMVGSERWYEKISLTYSGELSNSISTKEDQLLKSNLIKDWRNGMQHRLQTDATFQVLKYINITPSFSLRDLMYTNRIMRSWDEERQQEVCDTTYGFYNLYDWNIGVSANTTLYGFYKPWRKLFGNKIEAVRHVLKPSISFSYAPDFTARHYGYTRTYDKTDAYGNTETVSYSPYSRGLYGYPSGTKQGMVTMSLSNNLEMKVRSDKDSTGFKKISLIDELSASLSYNFAAKTHRWSDLSTRLRLKLTKNYTFSLSAVFATYAYKFNDQGQVVTSDRTEWSYGRFGRFQGLSQNLSYTFNNQTFSKILALFGGGDDKQKGKEQTDNDDELADVEDANVDPDLVASRKSKVKKKEKAKVDKDGYKTFSIPWSLTLSYGITMFENRRKPINPVTMRYPYGFTQTLNASGYVRIADGWNISFVSGYDFEYHKISMTTASLSRDLHCFEMSASVVLRPYTSFNFTFRARANELTDALKWDKRSSYSSNIEWY